nr:monovalent cation/H(+) antiporter subunit G [Halomonas campisalis]
MAWFGSALVLIGLPFFVAGSLGLVRFPDVYARLHALTKADTLGLGLICLGLAVQAGSLAAALKYLLIWLLMLVASSIGATLIAATALACGITPRTPAAPTSERPAPRRPTAR